MKTKGILLQIMVMLVGMIKGFVSLKLMVGFGHEQYAMLSQFLVLSMFAVQLILLSFDAPFVAQTHNSETIGFSAILHVLLLNTGLLWLASFFFDEVLARLIWGSSQYIDYVPILIAYIFSQALNLTNLLCFQSRKRFDNYASLQMGQQLFQLLAIAIGCYLKNLTLLLSLLIFFELLVFFVGRLLGDLPKFKFNKITQSIIWLKQARVIAVPLFFSFLMIWLLNNGGRILLVEYGGLKSLASYAATYSIAILSGLLINPVCSVFFPYLSRAEKNGSNAVESVVMAQIILFVITGLTSLVLIIAAKVLISFLASIELYAGGYFVFGICAAQLLYGQARILSLFMAVNSRARSGLFAFSSGAMVLILLGPLAISIWQEAGVALILFCSCLIASVFLWLSSASLLDKADLIRGRFTVIFCYFLTLGLMLLAVNWQAENVVDIFFRVPLFVFAYVFLLYLVFLKEPLLRRLNNRGKGMLGGRDV